MRTIAYVVASALMAVVLAGCGAGPFGSDEPDVEIDGTWTLTSGSTVAGDLVAPEDSRITLTFDAETATGFASCNNFGSDYELGGDDLEFGDFESSLMGCEDPHGAFEDDYLAALTAVSRVERNGDNLTLTGEGVSLEYVAVPPWPEAEVVGHTWRLHEILPDRDPLAGDPATLHLDADGAFAVSTGCQSFTGDWGTFQGDVIVTKEFYSDPNCARDVTFQDTTVTSVLSRFSAEVDGDELVLTSRGSTQDGQPFELVYRR